MSFGNGTGRHETLDVTAIKHAVNLGHVVIAFVVFVVGAVGGALAYFGGFARADAVDRMHVSIISRQDKQERETTTLKIRMSVTEQVLEDLREMGRWQNETTYRRVPERERRRLHLPPPPTMTTKEEE